MVAKFSVYIVELLWGIHVILVIWILTLGRKTSLWALWYTRPNSANTLLYRRSRRDFTMYVILYIYTHTEKENFFMGSLIHTAKQCKYFTVTQKPEGFHHVCYIVYIYSHWEGKLLYGLSDTHGQTVQILYCIAEAGVISPCMLYCIYILTLRRKTSLWALWYTRPNSANTLL